MSWSHHREPAHGSLSGISARAVALIAVIFAAGLGFGIGASRLLSPSADSPKVAADTSSPNASSPTAQSAATDSENASDPCAGQTWPYVDDKCRAQLAEKGKEKGKASREVRVIPTDKNAPPTIVSTPAPEPQKAPVETAKRETIGQTPAEPPRPEAAPANPPSQASAPPAPAPAPTPAIEAQQSAPSAAPASAPSATASTSPASAEPAPPAANESVSRGAAGETRAAENDNTRSENDSTRSKRSKRAERKRDQQQRRIAREHSQPQDERNASGARDVSTAAASPAPSASAPSSATASAPAASPEDTLPLTSNNPVGIDARTDTQAAGNDATRSENPNGRSTRSKRADSKRDRQNRSARTRSQPGDDDRDGAGGRGASGATVRTYEVEGGRRITVYQRGPTMQVGDTVDFGDSPFRSRRRAAAERRYGSRDADVTPQPLESRGFGEFFFGR